MRYWLAVVALSGCSGPAQPVATPPAPVSADAGPVAADAADESAAQMAAIEDAIGERGPGVYACRSRATADDLKLDGEVQLNLTLDGASKVKSIAVGRDTTGDARLLSCLRALWDSYSFEARFADGDVVALPPYKFVSEGAQYMVSADHVEATSATGGVAVASVLNAKNTGNPAADLEILTLEDGAEMARASGAGDTDLIYVLVGRGRMSARGVKGSFSGGAGFYAPASTHYHFTDIRDSNPTVLLRLRVHGGAKGRRVYARRAKRAEELAIAGGKARVNLYFDKTTVRDGAGYLGHFQATPGTQVPEHVHAGSTELLFVLAGEAKMSVEGKWFPIQVGDAVQIPPGTKHAAEVVGTAPFEAVQFYTPSGPEQRFRQNAKK